MAVAFGVGKGGRFPSNSNQINPSRWAGTEVSLLLADLQTAGGTGGSSSLFPNPPGTREPGQISNGLLGPQPSHGGWRRKNAASNLLFGCGSTCQREFCCIFHPLATVCTVSMQKTFSGGVSRLLSDAVHVASRSIRAEGRWWDVSPSKDHTAVVFLASNKQAERPASGILPRCLKAPCAEPSAILKSAAVVKSS